MKNIIPYFCVIALLTIAATIDPVRVGTNPNDGQGDSLRNAMIKINTNLVAINNALSNLQASAAITASLTNASTNSFLISDGKLYSKALLSERNVFWDDFEGPEIGVEGLRQRVSPSGHRVYIEANNVHGTNGLVMRNGYLMQTNETGGAFYYSWSNALDTATTRPINRQGVAYATYWDLATFPISQVSILRSVDAVLGSVFFHGPYIANDYVKIDRGIIEQVLFEQIGFGQISSNIIRMECTVISNTAIVDVNGFIFVATHTNMLSWAGYGPVFIWEINGSTDNPAVIDAAWAGYADPALVALADLARGKGLGTNGIELLAIKRPTLVTNTYLSTIFDKVVAMPNASASVGGRTNTLPALGTTPGITITVYDEGQTAAGTNIWIITPDGNTINRGPTRTNITANGGSMTFLSTPYGWTITGKFP